MEEASRNGDRYSRLIGEFCALLVTIISSEPAVAASSQQQQQQARRPPRGGGMSAAAAASMLLGASMALMLCGSVTFAIGFLLMPWVAGLALLFGFAGVVSTLSSGFFGRPGVLPYKDAKPLRGSPISSVPDKLVA